MSWHNYVVLKCEKSKEKRAPTMGGGGRIILKDWQQNCERSQKMSGMYFLFIFTTISLSLKWKFPENINKLDKSVNEQHRNWSLGKADSLRVTWKRYQGAFMWWWEIQGKSFSGKKTVHNAMLEKQTQQSSISSK